MSDEAQRMTALKRAYADIIFNTTKESATRILASERRALQLQQNLSLVKEESLAMLLRLKAIMEAKITESEKANLSQVKKIQELEVELREANDKIHYLKSEVRRLNSELDRKSDIETKFIDEKKPGSSVSCKKYNIREDIYKSGSRLHSPNGLKIIKNSSRYFTKDVTRHEPMKNLVRSNHYGGNLDFASVTQSNKEPEFYRDGCIHRTQAFEEIHDQESNSTTMCVNKKAEGAPPGHSRASNHVADLQHKKAERAFPQKFGTTKKRLRRNTRQRKFLTWPTSSDTLHDMLPQGLLKSSYSSVRQSDLDRSAENMHRNGRTASPDCSAQMPGEDQESEENRKTNLNRSFRKKNLGLSNGSGVMASGTILKPCNSSSSGTTCQENGLKEPLMMNARVLIDDSVSDDDGKNSRTTEQKMPAKSYCNLEQNLDTSATKEETTNAPPSDHKDEPCKPTESDVVEGAKLLKYTFQRKRKRGCMDSKVGSKFLEEKMSKKNVDKGTVENLSPRDMDKENEENVSTRKMDNDNVLVENHKSSMVVESSRDSRRMAQVARQLISLSERRWW
ncbi:uncharacterized protein LOC122042183 [Zingiber officinale]|uniref:uncharacterized protein LOC122042183 n=1 Tax=Zingiber officinale TaxID=94328 RepID=UPI001C4C9FA5|nr:uncharacterized protein LOC122042183 [Zingiber officinale]